MNIKQASSRCRVALTEFREALTEFETFKPAHKDSLIGAAQWMNLRLCVEVKSEAVSRAVDDLITVIDQSFDEDKP